MLLFKIWVFTYQFYVILYVILIILFGCGSLIGGWGGL